MRLFEVLAEFWVDTARDRGYGGHGVEARPAWFSVDSEETAMSDGVVSDSLRSMLDYYYSEMDGNEAVEEYHRRHGTESAAILTIYNDEAADTIVELLRPRIEGRIVVEVGAGIGLLACHLAGVARKVYAIETDPTWTSCFLAALYRKKPANLTFIFGRAEDAPHIAADVALFCTHSGHEAMYRAASRFAPEVIDVYRELVPDYAEKLAAARTGSVLPGDTPT